MTQIILYGKSMSVLNFCQRRYEKSQTHWTGLYFQFVSKV